jgi:hypothetical protein
MKREEIKQEKKEYIIDVDEKRIKAKVLVDFRDINY